MMVRKCVNTERHFHVRGMFSRLPYDCAIIAITVFSWEIRENWDFWAFCKFQGRWFFEKQACGGLRIFFVPIIGVTHQHSGQDQCHQPAVQSPAVVRIAADSRAIAGCRSVAFVDCQVVLDVHGSRQIFCWIQNVIDWSDDWWSKFYIRNSRLKQWSGEMIELDKKLHGEK